MIAVRMPASPKALTVFLFLLAYLLSGCAASTKVVRNEEIKLKEYNELYFVPPKDDFRNIVPKVTDEFKKMGFNVHPVDREKFMNSSQGTGFLITKQGHVLTCAHVIGEEKEATLWIGGVRYEADVLNKDKEKDLALLKLRRTKGLDAAPVSFRDKKNYVMGEEVFVIGFPLSNVLGSNARLTKGLISAPTGMRDDPNQIQISAQVQPGNSGGPLFDTQGTVLGVVQQTLNPWRMSQQTGGALPQNINFAIKSDVVLNYLKSVNKPVYDAVKRNQGSSIDKLAAAAAKIRSGIVPELLDKQPKLVARLEYLSKWDIWYRFNYFLVFFYDYDTQELLFVAGQGHDNMVSNEDVVIRDTFDHIRKTLNKN